MSTKKSSLSLLSHSAALVAGLALVALPAVASAQSLGAPAQTQGDGWRACLNGERPSTTNAQPTDPATLDADSAHGFSGHILDLDPTSDEVVIDFADSLSDRQVEQFGRKWGLTLRLNSRYSDAPNVYVATVDEGMVPYIKDCLAERASGGTVESVEENIQYSMLGKTPDDPLYQFQWNFKQIGMENAWESTAGDGVVVAVADTGVAFDEDPDRNITQPKDLEGTARTGGYDFVDDDDFAWDGHGHGTHVAGTIAQTTDNGFGVAGVAHDSTIMPLRVLNSDGFGSIADIADSIRFAADEGADVINMSLGGPIPSLVLRNAIRYAHKKGVTIVAAAGNGGKRAPSYPAAYKHVIAVAATQYDKTTTFYSQWGKFVDVAAPGGNTRVDQNDDGRPDGVLQQTLKEQRTDEHDFVLYMGTSMASPHAAGTAALIISQGVNNPAKVQEIMSGSADTSQRDRFNSDKEYQERYGAGIIQADEAATKANVGPGGIRFLTGMLLAGLAFFGVRRKDLLSMTPKVGAGFVASTVMTASGLFFLPLLVDIGSLGGLLGALARPVAELDVALLGPAFDQSPLLASFALPLAAIGLLGGSRRWRGVAAGVAIGTSAFLLAETWLMTSDVNWIPGMAGLLDQTWLAVNGLVSFTIGYFGLKRY